MLNKILLKGKVGMSQILIYITCDEHIQVDDLRTFSQNGNDNIKPQVLKKWIEMAHLNQVCGELECTSMCWKTS